MAIWLKKGTARSDTHGPNRTPGQTLDSLSVTRFGTDVNLNASWLKMEAFPGEATFPSLSEDAHLDQLYAGQRNSSCLLFCFSEIIIILLC